jgi:hypothetical protein
MKLFLELVVCHMIPVKFMQDICSISSTFAYFCPQNLSFKKRNQLLLLKSEESRCPNKIWYDNIQEKM